MQSGSNVPGRRPSPSARVTPGAWRWRRNLGVRQGAMVLLADAVRRQRRAEGVACRIVRPEPLRHGPLHDCADPLAHPSCSLALPIPDRQPRGHDVGRIIIE